MPLPPQLRSIDHPLAAPARLLLVQEWSSALGRDERQVAPLVDAVTLVARDAADGTLRGIAWAYPSRVEMLGGRSFLVLETDARPGDAATVGALREAAFARLAAGRAARSGDDDPPVGVCIPIADREELAARPEAVWGGEPPWAYAGYLPDARQLRIAFFAGARVGAGGQR